MVESHFEMEFNAYKRYMERFLIICHICEGSAVCMFNWRDAV